MDIYTKDAINNKLTKKQDTLVSGTNIKTINGNSLLGSGNVTISGGGSGGSVSSADFANANTQLNGLSINGTNYKLLDVKANDGKSLIIGENRSLASNASNAIAIGACESSAASSGRSTALGYSSMASGYDSTAIGHNSTASSNYSIALGSGSSASGNYSTAIGSNSTASGNYSTAIGIHSEVYVPYWVSFDGDTNRTLALQSTDNIFFRNEYVDNTKFNQESYKSGKTLTQLLSGSLVRINITGISDETTGKKDNMLTFVGLQSVIDKTFPLETLSSNWKTLMAGEDATMVWAYLCQFLSLGVCCGCFYTVGGDIEQQETVSAIVKFDYLGYTVLNGTTPEGHVVFNSQTTLKAAFAESTMELDTEL